MNDNQKAVHDVNSQMQTLPRQYCVEAKHIQGTQGDIGSLVRIATQISSMAKMLLIRSYQQVVRQLNEVTGVDKDDQSLFKLCYCDTDSLYIDTSKYFLKEF